MVNKNKGSGLTDMVMNASDGREDETETKSVTGEASQRQADRKGEGAEQPEAVTPGGEADADLPLAGQ